MNKDVCLLDRHPYAYRLGAIIHICVHVYVGRQVCLHTDLQTCLNANRPVCMQTNMSVYIYVGRHVCLHTDLHTCLNGNRPICIHTCRQPGLYMWQTDRPVCIQTYRPVFVGYRPVCLSQIQTCEMHTDLSVLVCMHTHLSTELRHIWIDIHEYRPFCQHIWIDTLAGSPLPHGDIGDTSQVSLWDPIWD